MIEDGILMIDAGAFVPILGFRSSIIDLQSSIID